MLVFYASSMTLFRIASPVPNLYRVDASSNEVVHQRDQSFPLIGAVGFVATTRWQSLYQYRTCAAPTSAILIKISRGTKRGFSKVCSLNKA